ncbi:hypothetical protein GCM10011369_05720 [Neiella marina]|uniref:Uncharacterized protein n=1 Tax=Neiella marina TaxID=508461 RepID=A0A8J2U2H4_9GAMM|nr:hypothetical protein [Neiella marina]GGA66943.1 hypothetical protein GCM10011369_05720 [Neiella marina]
MKNLLIATLLGASLFSANALANPYAYVDVYSDTYLKGAVKRFYPGQSVGRLGQMKPSWNDEISSIQVVGDNVCAMLFSDKGFDGKLVILSESHVDLGEIDFNNKATAIHVVQGACDESSLTYFYKKTNYGGNDMALPIGFSISSLDDTSELDSDWTDEIESIKVGSGACAKLYQHEDYGDHGPVLQATSSMTSLPSEISNHASLKIVSDKGWNCSGDVVYP